MDAENVCLGFTFFSLLGGLIFGLYKSLLFLMGLNWSAILTYTVFLLKVISSITAMLYLFDVVGG